MSVIGKLDKQVEEIIINPLSGRAPNNEESDADAGENVASGKRKHTQEKQTRAPAREDKEQELPVWLL